MEHTPRVSVVVSLAAVVCHPRASRCDAENAVDGEEDALGRWGISGVFPSHAELIM